MADGKIKAMDFYVYNFPFSFTAVGQQLELSRNILQKGAFDLVQLTHNFAAADARFSIEDTSYSKTLMNNQVPLSALAGSARFPFTLPVSYTFLENRAITVRMTNGATAVNAGTLTLIGATKRDLDSYLQPSPLIPVDYPNRNDIQIGSLQAQFFAYALRLQFTANNQVINDSITIFNENAFELFYVSGSNANPYTVNIEDAASGRRIFNEQTPAANIVGNGTTPYKLPFTRIFPPKGTINISAINGPASGANDGWLVFAGANLRSNEV